MSKSRVLALCCAVLLGAPRLVVSAQQCDAALFENNTDYHDGQGIGHANATSPEDCCSKCQLASGCTHWTLAAGTCWFKADDDGRRACAGAVSGRTLPPPRVPTPAPGAPQTYALDPAVLGPAFDGLTVP